LGAGPEAKAVQRQLSRLFGESLLGAWPELGQKLASIPPSVRQRHHRGFFAWAALAILGVAFAITWTNRPKLDRTGLQRRAHYAEELGTFLQDGELERASEFVALVRGDRAGLDPADPHLDRMIRAEAAIYRYSDADPARLARIRPFLQSSSGSGSPERLIAGLTVLSREERAERWSLLVGLRASRHGDPEFFYLLATAQEARGDVGAAREAWQRSAELGPAWLSHRFEQAEFERRRGDEAVAARVATQMLRADPESAWSRLASSEFQVRTAPVASTGEGGRVPRVPPPVEVYHGELLGALHAVRGHDLGGAKQHLAAAVHAVNGQAPFVLDAFDWLLEADLKVLAEELTRLPAWPRDSQAARRKIARLSREATARAAVSARDTVQPSEVAP
jgi:tetratricopeptide (TPR) repeat protein